MDKPIAIWGTDIEAAKIYYKLEKDGQYVETFFDNRIEEDTYFLDKSVRKPTAELVKKYFVYVGCKYHTYRTIADQLEGYGMEEIKDFLWYDLFKKKIVILHGNCHMEILRRYLLATRGFGVGGGYGIYPTELIHNNKKGYLNESVLQACDILIQQDVRDENAYGYKLGTNYLKSKLNKKAKSIVIPNLFGLGKAFFPYFVVGNKENEVLRSSRHGMFPRSWLLVDEMLSEGRSKDEIIAKLNDKFLIPQDEILDNFTNCIDQIRMREEKCDIRISDFILKHYRETPMFFDIGHPTDIVMKEMWRQVCNIIGVEAELEADVNGRMDDYEDPILPCVTYGLNLQYDRSRIRKSIWNWRLKEYMDLNEYVEEYIWWKNKSIHGRLLKEII